MHASMPTCDWWQDVLNDLVWPHPPLPLYDSNDTPWHGVRM